MKVIRSQCEEKSSFQFKASQRFYMPIKRLIGLVGSMVGITVCFLLLWWWILPINTVVTKGHPFFQQERLGKHKRVFKLVKFRSMKIDANPNFAPSNMTAEKQLSMETRFGRFLRKTSLDETMQLFNILLGDMAFIGPRPGASINEEVLVSERERYSPSAYEVKPGLSGLAQVRMRRNHDPKEKARYDHEYVANISFFNDVKLFLATVLRLFNSGAR